MPLEFLKDLSEEQILALINYVNKKEIPNILGKLQMLRF